MRSPRHLWQLSLHREYYAGDNRYTFLQEMDLDYEKYTGSYGQAPDAELKQKPVGTDAGDAFRNTYNGGCHLIVNVPLDTESAQYAGLFGYNNGTIRNVVYLGTAIDYRTHSAREFERNVTASAVYVGTLVGGNSGNISNCAVTAAALHVSAYSYSSVCAGGFAGVNYGAITGSEAALHHITATANYSDFYAGGFVGQNGAGGSIRDSYAIGRITASRAREGDVRACGFAGGNAGVLRDSYAAVDLNVSGGAMADGFCADNSNNCYYLNQGNFRYADAIYSAQYTDGRAEGLPWSDMTDNPSGEFGSSSAKDLLGSAFAMDGYQYGSADGAAFVFPASVRDARGRAVHYGEWPSLIELGVLGVYYWEKEVTYADDRPVNEAYHFSAINVERETETVSRIRTLCENHDDGGVIEEYGYGYYYSGEGPVGFTHPGTSVTEAAVNPEAEEALKKLMPGNYTFVAYTTAEKDPGTGKYATKMYLNGSDTEDTWAFTYGVNKTYSFQVNPFFAEALSIVSSSGLKLEDGSLAQVRGTEEEAPYGVRSVEQLWYINWNRNGKNTDTIISESGNVSNIGQFPYLSGPAQAKAYFWRQSHDLRGMPEVPHEPIAGYTDPDGTSTKDKSVGTLLGWFGGSYDGGTYKIEDVSISSAASCVGLFGVTYNASLKNIVLFSSGGGAYVEITNANTWYALGGLVGLAAQTEEDKMISNCCVAGYQIIDSHGRDCGLGGAGVGGLLGICNMALRGCTAAANITIKSKINDSGRNIRVGGMAGSCQNRIEECYAGGTISVAADTGFVGNSGNGTGLFIGGIVGGAYMKTLKVGNDTTINSKEITEGNPSYYNYFSKCYSYVSLPRLSGKTKLAYYMVGGRGELGKTQGVLGNGTEYNDCYYLKGVVEKNLTGEDIKEENNDRSGALPISYEQLSGREKTADNQLFLDILNEGKNGPFGTVTTVEDGNNVKGKYSRGISRALTREDYPFPTILTQENAGETKNVHYGDWPLAGIERTDGDVPVNIDLFADYQESEDAGEPAGGQQEEQETGGAWQEVSLNLSDILREKTAGGTFTVSCINAAGEEETGGTGTPGEGGQDPDQPAAKAQFLLRDGTRQETVFEWKKGQKIGRPDGTESDAVLVITGLRAGSAAVTVGFEPPSGTDVTVPDLRITVNVTADLQLAPYELAAPEDPAQGEDPVEKLSLDEILVIASEDAESESRIELHSFDNRQQPLKESLREKIGLKVTKVNYDTEYIRSAETAEETAGCLTLLKARGAARGLSSITLEYEYTYNDVAYHGTSTVNTKVRRFELKASPAEICLDEENGVVTYGADMMEFLLYEGGSGADPEPFEPERVTVTRAYSYGPEIVYARVSEGALILEGRKPGTATIPVDLEFVHGGSTHTAVIYPVAAVYDSRLEAVSANMQEGTLYLYADEPEKVGVTAKFRGDGAAGVSFAWELSGELDDMVELEPQSPSPAPEAGLAESTVLLSLKGGAGVTEEISGTLTVTAETGPAPVGAVQDVPETYAAEDTPEVYAPEEPQDAGDIPEVYASGELEDAEDIPEVYASGELEDAGDISEVYAAESPSGTQDVEMIRETQTAGVMQAEPVSRKREIPVVIVPAVSGTAAFLMIDDAAAAPAEVQLVMAADGGGQDSGTLTRTITVQGVSLNAVPIQYEGGQVWIAAVPENAVAPETPNVSGENDLTDEVPADGGAPAETVWRVTGEADEELPEIAAADGIFGTVPTEEFFTEDEGTAAVGETVLTEEFFTEDEGTAAVGETVPAEGFSAEDEGSAAVGETVPAEEFFTEGEGSAAVGETVPTEEFPAEDEGTAAVGEIVPAEEFPMEDEEPGSGQGTVPAEEFPMEDEEPGAGQGMFPDGGAPQTGAADPESVTQLLPREQWKSEFDSYAVESAQISGGTIRIRWSAAYARTGKRVSCETVISVSEMRRLKSAPAGQFFQAGPES